MSRPPRPAKFLIVLVSSASSNKQRRRALRRSWFTFKTAANPWLTPAHQDSVELHFVVSAPLEGSSDAAALAAEQAEHGDVLLVDLPEGYAHLWRKALVSMDVLQQRCDFEFYMHADDDSYLRLDLLLPLLAGSPRQAFYWGYIWDGTGNRRTAPIRDPRNKSYMPVEQYAADHYPPFASGCGFVLSRDLVSALLRQPLPDYRLLDPPFGIHLCGNDACVVPGGPIQPTHDERVRPYRGIPIFCADTIVQHYLAPEEMAPYHQQVLAVLKQKKQQAGCQQQQQPVQGASAAHPHCNPSLELQPPPPSSAPDELYAQLVQLGLLRR